MSMLSVDTICAAGFGHVPLDVASRLVGKSACPLHRQKLEACISYEQPMHALSSLQLMTLGP